MISDLVQSLPLELFLNKPRTVKETKDGLYRVYNMGSGETENLWFVRFLRHHFPDNKTVINFFGPFGPPYYIKKRFEGKKVFYTGEDVEHPGTNRNLNYGNYMLNYVDLALGFGEVNNEKYLRFPYWIVLLFSPQADEQEIREKIRKINTTRYAKNQECVLINKHDGHGTRELVYNGVKDILDVKLAGPWRNNTDELWTKYGDNKELYMRNFKFNICAEHNNTLNYVSEKLFDAFVSDCIPIYYGACNNPEPGLINRDAVIFWNKDGSNKENREKILELKNNEKFYKEFMSQPKLLPAAEEYIIDRYSKLKERFAEIIKQ
jgi:hypothetical protein